MTAATIAAVIELFARAVLGLVAVTLIVLGVMGTRHLLRSEREP